jgi:glycosyltransferase involved in cell wall biosynthesis
MGVGAPHGTLKRPDATPTLDPALRSTPSGGVSAPRTGTGLAPGPPPKVLFVGRLYAGHRTRFANLRRHSEGDPRIEPEFQEVSGWKEAGRLEHFPLLPRSVRGRARGVLEARSLGRLRRPDVIWTSVDNELAPYVWAQVGPLRRPLVVDFDATPGQLEEFSPLYFGRPPRTGPARWLRAGRQRLSWTAVSHFSAWSEWAAADLRRSGVPGEHISVLPPGVDLELWTPPTRAAAAPGSPVRLLFVGGDFERKGGPVLLDVVRDRLAGRVELDLVTYDQVTSGAGVRVHRARPNSPELQALFAAADLFVMPTRAECFGLATVEAMASGLPVLVGDVGAAGEIVDDGETGWLVRPTHAELSAALEVAISDPARLREMGRRARAAAERRFDGRRNDQRVIDLLLELHLRYLADQRP